ncbi:MAG: peptidoglycan bridge formation glycyltransferase FemA/FemB family protein [Chloroflexi bacterium]|nr:peptidoglycan bridge formation glycyltransferase FemA/FemB family protein [Chloroflexota bacterium]
MDIRECSDRDEWNGAVAALSTGHILQSWEWGALKGRLGWEPVRLLFTRGGQVVAAASVLFRRARLPGLAMAYAPKGPCVDTADPATLGQVLTSLADVARRRGAAFLRIDPDISLEQSAALRAVEGAGFRPAPEQVQYRNTMIVDLRPSVEELRKRLRQDAKYNTNLARRRGVAVVEGSADDLPLFYDVYRETSERDHFLIRPYAYYADIWRHFLDRGMARILFARHEEDTLAGAILLVLGDRVWYMYGASRGRHRQLKPNHLLQWEAMLWAKAQGAVSYDMWGLPNVLEPGQPMWGVVEFKQSFGGQIYRWIGAYDYVVRPPLYAAVTTILPRYLHLLRRLRGLPSAEAVPAGT